MPEHAAAVADRTVAVAPPIRCNHPDDVAEVRVTGDAQLWARFHDGTSGTVELHDLIHSARAGVFAKLRDPALFAQARIELGAVAWPDGPDLAPDAMYAAFRSSGTWTSK